MRRRHRAGAIIDARHSLVYWRTRLYRGSGESSMQRVINGIFASIIFVASSRGLAHLWRQCAHRALAYVTWRRTARRRGGA